MRNRRNLKDRVATPKRVTRNNDLSWKLNDVLTAIGRRSIFLWRKAWLAEAGIRQRLEGLPERLGFELDSSGRLVVDTQRNISVQFIWIDEFRWDYGEDDFAQNFNVLRNLLVDGGCPLKVLHIWHRPELETEFEEYIQEAATKSRGYGLWKPAWEEDQRATARYITRNRVQHEKFGVVASDYVPERLRAAVDSVSLTADEILLLLFSIYHGVWNQTQWLRLKEQWEKDGLMDSLPNALIPNVLTREYPLETPRRGKLKTSKGIKLVSSFGETYLATLRTPGLGVRLANPHDPKSTKLATNTERWLESFLPFLILKSEEEEDKTAGAEEEVHEAVLLETTYWAPPVDPVAGKSLLLQIEEGKINRLQGKKEKEDEDKKKLRAKGKKGEDAKPRLNTYERSYLEGFRRNLKRIRDSEEPLVNVTYKFAVQSSDRESARLLLQSLNDRLRKQGVLVEPVTQRESQLQDLRSFTLITKRDVEENTSPLPLETVVRNVVPPPADKIPEGRIKYLAGVKLPLREPWWLEVFESGCFVGLQKVGKTAFLRADLWRAAQVVPPNKDGELGVFLVYDGTDADKDYDPEDRGWYAIGGDLNVRLSDPAEAVLYATDFTSRQQAYGRILELRDMGARVIVWNALERHHWKHDELDLAFFEAYEEIMRPGIPGGLYVDEVLHMSKDERAKRLFMGIAPQISKRNQVFRWTAQTTLAIPDDWLASAQQNTDILYLAPTHLVIKLAEEANINIKLHPERVEFLEETLGKIADLRRKGLFIRTEFGGRRMNIVEYLIKYGALLDMVRRKTEEEEAEMGA